VQLSGADVKYPTDASHQCVDQDGIAASDELDRPLVGVEGLIGGQHIRPHIRQDCVSAHQVMGLSSGQMETNRIAEGINQGVDFRVQTAEATVNVFTITEALRQVPSMDTSAVTIEYPLHEQAVAPAVPGRPGKRSLIWSH
jgi:hypothetical protein